MSDLIQLQEELWDWAAGTYPTMAGTELLIRGGFVDDDLPWIKGPRGQRWVDFEAIPRLLRNWPGKEQRFLSVASSLGGTNRVLLRDVLTGLDRETAQLILAALSHTTGHQARSSAEEPNGRVVRIRPRPLVPWPHRPN